MKILIISGENIKDSSRKVIKVLNNAKKKGYLITRIDNEEGLLNNLQNTGLFEEKAILLVSDKSLINQKTVKLINKLDQKQNIYLIININGNFNPPILKNINGEIKRETFDYPKILYRFFSTLLPGNYTEALKLLKQLKLTQDDESVFYALAGYLRDLLWVVKSPGNIPYPSWRVNNLEINAKKLGEDKIVAFIDELSKIDIEYKTSSIAISHRLDLVVARLLK